MRTRTNNKGVYRLVLQYLLFPALIALFTFWLNLSGTRPPNTSSSAPQNGVGTSADLATTKSSHPAPMCPICGAGMILRHNQETREEFWGCEKFPSCRGTRPLHGEQPTKPGEQPTKPANSSLVAAIPPARISPVDGLKHVEEYCKVEMAVSVAETGKSGVIFLNSEPQYRSPKNFGIMLSVTALGELKMVQIDPLTFFKGRTIRVTGVVREYLGHAEIIVDHKGQIEWDGMPGK